MKGDGVLNLLIFQAFQDVRMASSLVRMTPQSVEIAALYFKGLKNQVMVFILLNDYTDKKAYNTAYG